MQKSSAAHARPPTAKVGADAVQAAQVMVDAFRLPSEAPGDDAILNGILDGIASLVHHDAAGVYIIRCCRRAAALHARPWV